MDHIAAEAVETARKSFEAARAEILARITLRDQVTLAYIAVGGSLLGIVAGTSIGDQARITLGLIAPFLSVIVAYIVRGHNHAIDQIASMIRYEINPFLIACGAWAPHWDWYGRRQSKWEETNDGAKMEGRRVAEIVVLNLPSILTFAYTTAYLMTAPVNWPEVPGGGVFYSIEWCGGLLCLFLAARITWVSISDRALSWTQSGGGQVVSPLGYEEFLELGRKGKRGEDGRA